MRSIVVIVAALWVGTSIANAQPSLPPISDQWLTGLTTPPQSDPKAPFDSEAWEQAMNKISNIRVELTFTREDAVFHKSRKYTGVLLFLRPNFMIMRLNYTKDPTHNDYEAYICDGKSVFKYNGLNKSVTEYKLPTKTSTDNVGKHNDTPTTTPANSTEDPVERMYADRWRRYFVKLFSELYTAPLKYGELISGMNPKDLGQEFNITVIKKDGNYIYLDMKPILEKDKKDIQQIRMALYGPKTNFAYLPAQIRILKTSGDTELWDLANPRTNLPGIDEKLFRYVEVKGFTLETAPDISVLDAASPTPTTPDNDMPDNKTPEPPVSQSYYPAVIECPCVPRVCFRDRLRWRLRRN